MFSPMYCMTVHLVFSTLPHFPHINALDAIIQNCSVCRHTTSNKYCLTSDPPTPSAQRDVTIAALDKHMGDLATWIVPQVMPSV